MIAIDGGAAELENAGSQWFIGGKAELLLGVVPKVALGSCPGLHPVRAHDAASGIVLKLVFHQQVLTAKVELIRVQTGAVRAIKAFA
jgi:hypothetical protein